MFPFFLGLFVAFLALDAFFSIALIYHLWNFTLPEWKAPKIVIPSYLILTLIFLGFALISFSRIPF